MINAAIVGLGRWGQNLVDHVQGKSDEIRFTAAVTRTVEKARDYAAKQGFPLYGNLDAVLADPSIDAVVLATPHTQHAEHIIAAARAGKHVFTEKPFTLDRASALAAVDACAQHNVTLAVGYNWRFQPALGLIKWMLADGRLGTLLHIEGNFCGPSVYRYSADHWRQSREEGPGGGMTGRGVHIVDAMLYLGGHMDSVYAQSARRAQTIGIDDTTSMLFKFKSGASGYLGTFIGTAETWRMQVFGSRGWAEVGDVEHLTTWQLKTCFVDPENPFVNQRPEVTRYPNQSTERAELEHFAQAAAARRPIARVNGDEVHGVAVLDAVMQSIREERNVAIG